MPSDRWRGRSPRRIHGTLVDVAIAVEDCSAVSLAHCTMKPDGYAFMLARRRRTDPDAEAKIAATANICPACGPLDQVGRRAKGTPDREIQ